ncbi:MAG: response regulator transcription factor [Flavobacteriales bacterium]|jgi:DNA-binding LytR/AlgR family response regulator|nr:response regulator transcription factor [Flavobacteriales bacterium]
MKLSCILIVEDDVIIAKAFAHYLIQKGYENIKIARTFSQAIACINEFSIDIALLDINLNEKNSGIDLAKILVKQENIPFVFISSHFDDETIERARATHPNGFLTKPINKDTLYTTLEMISLNSRDADDVLIIKDGYSTIRLDIRKILFIEADHVYVNIYLENKNAPILVRNSLQNLEQLIHSSDFIKIHRKYLIHTKKVEKYNSSKVFINGTELPIGTTRKKNALKLLGSL